jgi:hypothetical protein
MTKEGILVVCPFCQTQNTIPCGDLKSSNVRFVCTTCGEKSQVTGIADYYFVPFRDLNLHVASQTYSYEDGCGRYTIAVDDLREEYTDVTCERQGVRRKISVFQIPTEFTDVVFDFEMMRNTSWMVFTDPQGDVIHIPFCKLYTGMMFAGRKRAGRDQRYRLVNFPDVFDVPFEDLEWKAGEEEYHYTSMGGHYIIPIWAMEEGVVWSAENGACRQQIRVVDVPLAQRNAASAEIAEIDL